MHTFESGRYCLHYNSDLSGDVEIVKDGQIHSAMEIEGAVLLGFVASFVRNEKKAALDDATDQYILGLSLTTPIASETHDWHPHRRRPMGGGVNDGG